MMTSVAADASGGCTAITRALVPRNVETLQVFAEHRGSYPDMSLRYFLVQHKQGKACCGLAPPS